MSTGVRVPAAEALAVATVLTTRLAQSCSRIEIAGSLRRRSPDVGDIEVVAESLTHTEPSGLFFDVEATVYDLELAVARLPDPPYERLLGKDRYTKLRHRESGLQIDLFTVKPPATWGVILTIRTGPAAFSQQLVTDVRRRGLHVRGGALHRGSLSCEGGSSSRCEVIPTPTEEAFFEAIGVRWIAPEHR